MRFFASPDFDLPLPVGHRFPSQKYTLLRQLLLDDGILRNEQLAPAPRALEHTILSVHSSSYVAALNDGSIDPKQMRRIGFPWSPHIPKRGQFTVGGALAAAEQAISNGLSGHLAGGTHHAHHGFGSGFCIYNDLAAVAVTLLIQGVVERIAIIDLDVHQGDGNAAILGQREDVFILDIYGEKNFPFRKVPSSLDVPLLDGCEDAEFLAALDKHLPSVWTFRPDIVLYQAGVDALTTDRLGRLSLSFEGLIERDKKVLEGCHKRGIPCSMAIGGGYADPITDSVTAYANTYRVAKNIYGF